MELNLQLKNTTTEQHTFEKYDSFELYLGGLQLTNAINDIHAYLVGYENLYTIRELILTNRITDDIRDIIGAETVDIIASMEGLGDFWSGLMDRIAAMWNAFVEFIAGLFRRNKQTSITVSTLMVTHNGKVQDRVDITEYLKTVKDKYRILIVDDAGYYKFVDFIRTTISDCASIVDSFIHMVHVTMKDDPSDSVINGALSASYDQLIDNDSRMAACKGNPRSIKQDIIDSNLLVIRYDAQPYGYIGIGRYTEPHYLLSVEASIVGLDDIISKGVAYDTKVGLKALEGFAKKCDKFPPAVDKYARKVMMCVTTAITNSVECFTKMLAVLVKERAEHVAMVAEIKENAKKYIEAKKDVGDKT